jgi:hypothetical protein
MSSRPEPPGPPVDEVVLKVNLEPLSWTPTWVEKNRPFVALIILVDRGREFDYRDCGLLTIRFCIVEWNLSTNIYES